MLSMSGEEGELELDLGSSSVGRRLHAPVPEVGRWLGAVLRGHFNYYGGASELRRSLDLPLPRLLALAAYSAEA